VAERSAKDLRIEPIESGPARRFVRRHHYSGKVTQNSQIHLGAFLDGRLHGVLQFGPPLQRSNVLPLVLDTARDGMLELNRLAFDDALPRNSESRALSVSMRLLRKHYPQVEWVLSFADATQCGDGTIYRAAGFVLTGIKKNTTLGRLPDGRIVADVSLRTGVERTAWYANKDMRDSFERLPGFQLRYIYFLSKTARSRLTVPEIPFSEIEARGASMYKGKAREVGNDGHQPYSGGSTPTRALQP
jgi:hypothetical protein